LEIWGYEIPMNCPPHLNFTPIQKEIMSFS